MLCVELDCDKMCLFDGLINYCFEDEKIRNDKMEEYTKWWCLGSALWIKRL